MWHLNCIWFTDPLELLVLTGFSPTEELSWEVSFPEFTGKRIIDFWAGVSPFLNTILEVASPAEVLAIDPIYRDEGTYTTAVAKTLSSIEDDMDGIPPDSEDLYKRFSRVKDVLVSDTHHDSRVRKQVSMERVELDTYDYIFATDVFFHIQNTLFALAWLGVHLNAGGRLLITDSHVNIQANPEPMWFLQQFLKGGLPGISFLWKNETHISIWLEKTLLKWIYDMLISEAVRVNQ